MRKEPGGVSKNNLNSDSLCMFLIKAKVTRGEMEEENPSGKVKFTKVCQDP